MTTNPYRSLARYNRWANERLYNACSGLSDQQRREDRAAFFASIHGTLNHILLGDRIWLKRFAGGTAPSTGLDAILYQEFTELQAAREVEDLAIEAMVAGLEPGFEQRRIRYKNNQGLWYEDPLDLLLLHFFNHQTHHRGQVHDLICQIGVTPPVLDLHRVLRPDPAAADQP